MKFRIATALLLLPALIHAALPQFVDDYLLRASSLPLQVSSFIAADSLSADERLSLMMLYAYMPQSDALDRTPDFYLCEAVRPALAVRAKSSWQIPDELFYHYVLPLRVNNEALDAHRRVFQVELLQRVDECADMASAALTVNHWCHEKASYQPSDGRTHSPLQTLSSAIGRCGEESTFGVAAMRAVGIPARQVYTPRWAHTDDNHAWVEVWADGRWWFLGACEPEPVLNLGWFNEPASRGMLMHARTFGLWHGDGEILAVQNGNTDINVTANYARTDTVTIHVADADGRPVEGAEVSFRIYNYAEFYPIALKYTDSAGNASLITGHGDMLVWVRNPANGAYTFAPAPATADASSRLIAVCLGGAIPSDTDLFITPPPVSQEAVPAISDQLKKANTLLLAREDSLRNAYMATWPDSSYIAALASQLNINASLLQPIITAARGNHLVITDFLRGVEPESRATALLLLQSLAIKDLSDITPEVLRDVIDHLPPHSARLSTDDYGAYLLSPRVGLEELTPYRNFFLTKIPADSIAYFRAEPTRWVHWVKRNIAATLSWYPEQVTMSPESVYRNRVTSPLSRDIFFVAAARSWGIPARLNPITSAPQYFGGNGWIDADLSADTSASETESAGYLSLTYAPGGADAIRDPRYYTHFTISAISDGQPQLLSYPDFCSLSATFASPQPLTPGRYMLTSGRRTADGSVLSRMQFFDIIPQSNTSVCLSMLSDTTQLQVVGSLDAESLYLPASSAVPTSLLSTAGRGYYILGLLDADTEPSHHAINDLILAAAELDSLGHTIFLLYPEGNLPALPHALPQCVRAGTDIDSTIAKTIAEGLYIASDNRSTSRPVFIIADSFGRIVYHTSGYTIGLGTRLAEILRSVI